LHLRARQAPPQAFPPGGPAPAAALPALPALPAVPLAAVPAAIASPEALQAAELFAKMDLNRDGKVDVSEFVAAKQNGNLPLVAAPAPAPMLAVAVFSPGPAVAAAPGPAAKPEVDFLPAHLMVPPPLPAQIPEPPPPPHAPPPEPAPPPLPPKEGQLVGPPPSDRSMEPAGNVSLGLSSAPGLDLEGSDPVQAPAVPVPLPPPELPSTVPALEQPEKLSEKLMEPSPVAFGLDSARTLPTKVWPTEVVNVPDAAYPLQVTANQDLPAAPVSLYTSGPYRVLLSLSSHRQARLVDDKHKVLATDPHTPKLPEQGYEGKGVRHMNMKSITSDWGSEYGPTTQKPWHSSARGAAVAVSVLAMLAVAQF